jgi:hypothetical protein
MIQVDDTSRSEEFRRIIHSDPTWSTRWGITLLFLLFALLIGVTYTIPYTQSKVIPFTLTASSQSSALLTGLIHATAAPAMEEGQRVALRPMASTGKATGRMEGQITTIRRVQPNTYELVIRQINPTAPFQPDDTYELLIPAKSLFESIFL